jgi:hypothetical protein
VALRNRAVARPRLDGMYALVASNCRIDGHRPNSSQRMIRTGIGIPNSQRSAYRILLSFIVTGTTYETINLGAVSLLLIG